MRDRDSSVFDLICIRYSGLHAASSADRCDRPRHQARAPCLAVLVEALQRHTRMSRRIFHSRTVWTAQPCIVQLRHEPQQKQRAYRLYLLNPARAASWGAVFCKYWHWYYCRDTMISHSIYMISQYDMISTTRMISASQRCASHRRVQVKFIQHWPAC